MLREEPHAVGEEGVGDIAVVVEVHRVRVIPGLADAVVVAAQHALEDHVLVGVDIGLVGDDFGGLLAVGERSVDPLACFNDGGGHGARGVGVLLRELGSAAQRLFRMVLPDRLAGHCGESDLVHDGAVAPGLTHTKAVHVAHAHVGYHLRRRHDDVLDVLERVDAVGRKPVVQPHGMRAGREGLRERVVALFLLDECREAGTVGHALVIELACQRDGLAVVVQCHEDVHVLLRAADSHLHAVDQAIEHMCRVKFAVDELVAHAGPGGFLGRDDLDAVLLVELHHVGHDHRGAIGQRNEADLDFLFLGGIGTGSPGCVAYCVRDEAHDAHRERSGAGAFEEVTALHRRGFQNGRCCIR